MARLIGPSNRLFCWLVSFPITLFVLSVPLQADNNVALFEQANKLYEEGRYSESVASYQKLIRNGAVSAPLFFNLGNAFYKAGRTGRAVIAYRLAERLAPRDPDIKANLRFARESVPGNSPTRNSRWHARLRLFTLNELAWVCASAVWIWMSLLIVAQIRRDLPKSIRRCQTCAGLAVLFFVAWLGLAVREQTARASAVVVATEAVVRYGPLDESQSFYTIHSGTELTILDQKENWLQVVDGAGRVGWVKAQQVGRVEPASVSQES